MGNEDPSRCPNCGSEGDLFDTETDVSVDGERGNKETYSCENEECQTVWDARYRFIRTEVS